MPNLPDSVLVLKCSSVLLRHQLLMRRLGFGVLARVTSGLLGAHFTILPGVCSEVQNLGCWEFILPFYHFTWGSVLRSRIRDPGSSFYQFTIRPFDLGSVLRSKNGTPGSSFYHLTIWSGDLPWIPESGLMWAFRTSLSWKLIRKTKIWALGGSIYLDQTKLSVFRFNHN